MISSRYLKGTVFCMQNCFSSLGWCTPLFSVLKCFGSRYWLGPREDRSEQICKQELGSLRLRLCHTEDHVFPSSFYDPLRETILNIGDGQVWRKKDK